MRNKTDQVWCPHCEYENNFVKKAGVLKNKCKGCGEHFRFIDVNKLDPTIDQYGWHKDDLPDGYKLK